MYPDRPVLKLGASRAERVADAFTVLGLLVCVASVGATLLWVDGPVPMHMNAAGEVDAWGSSATVVIVAILALAMTAALAALRRSPYLFNYGSAVVTAENAPDFSLSDGVYR